MTDALPSPTVQAALLWAGQKLAVTPSPDLEAELLLAFVLNEDRAWLLANADHIMTKNQADSFISRVNERAGGQPLAYITGHKEFFGRDFIVSADTLIPRPESEILIHQATTIASRLTSPHLLDVGTGSGCLAVTLACELPEAVVTATDIEDSALKIAKQNAEHHHVSDRLTFKIQDLLIGETEKYDIVIANLPYVEEHWLAVSPHARELAAEPRTALSGGDEGIQFIKNFIRQFSATRCAPVVLLEHGDGQEKLLRPYAQKLIPHAHIRSVKDQFGVDRVLAISLDD